MLIQNSTPYLRNGGLKYNRFDWCVFMRRNRYDHDIHIISRLILSKVDNQLHSVLVIYSKWWQVTYKYPSDYRL